MLVVNCKGWTFSLPLSHFKWRYIPSVYTDISFSMSLKPHFILLRLSKWQILTFQYLTMKRTVVKFRRHEVQTSRFYLSSGSHKSDGVVLNGFSSSLSFTKKYIVVWYCDKIYYLIKSNLLKSINAFCNRLSYYRVGYKLGIKRG